MTQLCLHLCYLHFQEGATSCRPTFYPSVVATKREGMAGGNGLGLVWLEQKVERRQGDEQGRTPRPSLVDPSKEFGLSSECARSHWKVLRRDVT